MSSLSSFMPESAHRIRFVGHSDQAGRSDGAQVMVNKGHAFIGQAFSTGVSIINVSDPRAPQPVNFLPAPRASWTPHLQTHGDLLLVVEEFNLYSVFNTEKLYYGSSIQGLVSSRFGQNGEDFSAGLRVYDVSEPASPRAIGFMPVAGLGLHRLWWTGGRYAYASAMLDGFTDHILIIIDMNEPTRPVEAGRWWIAGMHVAAGETAHWSNRVALHHAVVADDVAYGCWRDGGLTILDVKDKAKPKLVAHRNWCPPHAGGTHSALPLHDRDLLIVADEAVHDIDVEPLKYTWVFDIRLPANPISIATLPTPSDQDYFHKGGHFGPHNLWENRPDAYQSSRFIFATYQNAGIRVFDIDDPYRPKEVAYFVPPPPATRMDTRSGTSGVLHTCDVFVQPDGLVYITDYNAGLYILQWEDA